jgi:hypothetical protein
MPPTFQPSRSEAKQGLHGSRPLLWWSAGWYHGPLQHLLLEQRRHPNGAGLTAPIQILLQGLATWPLPVTAAPLLLVPLPGWRPAGNPVPLLLAQQLSHSLQLGSTKSEAAAGCQLVPELLQRARRVACQHRLQREQRWRNQWLSFRARLAAGYPQLSQGTVVLVDDVLTSGATAQAAQQALLSAGWNVAGLLCLARTGRHAGRNTWARSW